MNQTIINIEFSLMFGSTVLDFFGLLFASENVLILHLFNYSRDVIKGLWGTGVLNIFN